MFLFVPVVLSVGAAVLAVYFVSRQATSGVGRASKVRRLRHIIIRIEFRFIFSFFSFVYIILMETCVGIRVFIICFCSLFVTCLGLDLSCLFAISVE